MATRHSPAQQKRANHHVKRPHHRPRSEAERILADIPLPSPLPDIPWPPPGFTTPQDPTGGIGIPDIGDLPGGGAIEKGAGKIGGAVGGVADDVAHAVSGILGWLLDPVRVVKVVGGGILLLLGVHLLIRQMTGNTVGGHVRGLGSTLLAAATFK